MEKKLQATQPTEQTAMPDSIQSTKKAKKKYHTSAMYAAHLCRSAITHVKPNTGNGLNL